MNERRQRLVLWIGALVLMLSLAVPKGHKSPPDGAEPVALRHDRSSVIVRVAGDVPHPGVYRLASGSTTRDLLAYADPKRATTGNEGSASVIPLTDGAVVTVTAGAGGEHRLIQGIMPVNERVTLGVPLNPEVMAATDWEALPGIGPALAQRIMAHGREQGGIHRIDDLAVIPGIGQRTLAKLRPLFRTESP